MENILGSWAGRKTENLYFRLKVMLASSVERVVVKNAAGNVINETFREGDKVLMRGSPDNEKGGAAEIFYKDGTVEKVKL